MTPEELDQIDARADAATPGSWTQRLRAADGHVEVPE
jgi:hypothetical protein